MRANLHQHQHHAFTHARASTSTTTTTRAHMHVHQRQHAHKPFCAFRQSVSGWLVSWQSPSVVCPKPFVLYRPSPSWLALLEQRCTLRCVAFRFCLNSADTTFWTSANGSTLWAPTSSRSKRRSKCQKEGEMGKEAAGEEGIEDAEEEE